MPCLGIWLTSSQPAFLGEALCTQTYSCGPVVLLIPEIQMSIATGSLMEQVFPGVAQQLREAAQAHNSLEVSRAQHLNAALDAGDMLHY